VRIFVCDRDRIGKEWKREKRKVKGKKTYELEQVQERQGNVDVGKGDSLANKVGLRGE